jgi:hypothetical protein
MSFHDVSLEFSDKLSGSGGGGGQICFPRPSATARCQANGKKGSAKGGADFCVARHWSSKTGELIEARHENKRTASEKRRKANVDRRRRFVTPAYFEFDLDFHKKPDAITTLVFTFRRPCRCYFRSTLWCVRATQTLSLLHHPA